MLCAIHFGKSEFTMDLVKKIDVRFYQKCFRSYVNPLAKPYIFANLLIIVYVKTFKYLQTNITYL